MNDSRTVKAARNSLITIPQQILTLLIGFVYRTLFLMVLSKEYLGLNGLFTNLLTLISMAELGIGVAIIYRLYKPVDEKDETKIICLMNFYKKIYTAIALIMLAIGLILMLFLRIFIADKAEIPSDINIYIIYSLFLLDNVASYFCAHKQGIVTADQRGWIISLIMMISSIVKFVAMVTVLFTTRNYTLTLVVSVITTISTNVFIAMFVNHLYPFLKKGKGDISKEEKKAIYKDTTGLLMHRIGGSIINGTDSIIMSSFIGIATLGLYSNYSLIINSIVAIMMQIINAFTASIGNLQVEASGEKLYEVYKKVQFLSCWLTGFCVICFAVLVNPFIKVWLGAEYLLGLGFVATISISNFLRIARIANTTFVTACGLYAKDKWRPIVEVILNLALSILLVLKFGIVGIFLGTIVSTLCAPFWREYYILNRDIFKRKWFEPMILQLLFLFFCAILTIGFYFLCGLLPDTIGFFIIKAFICIFGVNLIFLLCSFRTQYFKYYWHLFVSSMKKLKQKLLRGKNND